MSFHASVAGVNGIELSWKLAFMLDLWLPPSVFAFGALWTSIRTLPGSSTFWSCVLRFWTRVRLAPMVGVGLAIISRPVERRVSVT